MAQEAIGARTWVVADGYIPTGGIEVGASDLEVFSRYVAQDAFFLEAFARAYALAAARSRALEDIEAFAELLAGAIDERKTHTAYAGRLGVSLVGTIPNRACRAYTDFLLARAWQGDVGTTLAAMTPCMRLYSFLGRELARDGLPDHRYRDWIETYSSDEFASLAERIEVLLDRHASDTDEVRGAYRYAMACELEFFAAVLESEPEGAGR